MDKETATLLAAIIGFTGSCTVAVIAMISARRNGERVAVLAREKADRDARRDYEYEARKRLYVEVEPVLFEFFLLAEDAASRVLSLARTCREGKLRPDGSGWLSGEGYYYNSTAYALLAPLASIRMLQRRLTLVDLSLDPRLTIQYGLLRLLYQSFTEDHTLAKALPRISYDPDTLPGEASLKAEPGGGDLPAHVRQGLFAGNLDRLVDALLVRENNIQRVVSFGEFEEVSRESSTFHGLRCLLLRFHPLSRPILWRTLLTQELLYAALERSRSASNHQLGSIAELLPEAEELAAALEWRSGTDARGEKTITALQAARTCIVRPDSPYSTHRGKASD